MTAPIMTHVVSLRSRPADEQPALSTPPPDPLSPTVFHEPWWLDIVTRRSWQDAEVSQNGRVVGRLPYSMIRRLKGQVIGMPPLTHFLGPAIDQGRGSRQARWLRGTEITRELIRNLPPTLRYWQKFHGGVTDIVPFQAERFDTTVQFTFEIEPAPEAMLWAGLRDKHRNLIRRAGDRSAVEELTDATEFTRFYQQNLEARGRINWAPPDIMQALLTAAIERGAGTMFGVRDKRGALAAGVFCARDRRASYYSLSSRRADSGNGAIPLLIWAGIKRAARDGLTFDFDGLSAESSIRLYAGFGGITSPRYVATRSLTSGLIRAAKRRLGLETNTFGS